MGGGVGKRLAAYALRIPAVAALVMLAAAVLLALPASREAAAAPFSGPSTPVLDDFNRPDTTSGPPGPSWSSVPGTPDLRILGQQVTGSASGLNADFWNPQQYGPDSEVYVTVATKPTTDLDTVSLALRGANPATSTDGYQAYFYNRTGTDEYRIFKRVGGLPTQLAYAQGPELQPGDQLLFRAIGSTLEIWLGDAGTWTQVTSVNDTTFANAGYLGLTVKNTSARVDDFGGGSLTVAPAAPANTSPPVVSGSAQTGMTLTTTTGSWTGVPAPSLAYQWERCDQAGANCTAIAGANANTYLLAQADVGSTVRATVTATNSAGSASASSATTAVVVAASPPSNTSPPTTSGTAQVGSTLSAAAGTWTGVPAPTFAYQWQRCDSSGSACVGITGATAATYSLVGADAGYTLRVVVTGTNSSGSASANSAVTALVASAVPPANTAAPTISGGAVQGLTLTATSGTWSGSPPLAYSYQWQRCDTNGGSCNSVAGATQSSYTLTAADIGSTMRVVVTATNTAGTVYAYDSFQRTVQNDWGTPDVGGAWQIDSLQSSPGPPSDYSVSNGTAYIVSPGANQDLVRLSGPAVADADVYGAVSLSAVPIFASPPNALSFDVQLRDDGTGNNFYKFHVRFTSGGVADILLLKTVRGVSSVIAAPRTVASPYVPGTRIMFHARIVGSTLSFSGWVAGNPEPPWMITVNDNSLTGAQAPGLRTDFRSVTNNPTFTLDSFAVVSPGTPPPASAVSAPTGVVVAAIPPSNTAPPTISGSAVQGQNLTASTGTWSGSPTPTYTYQWQRCDQTGANCLDIAGATSSTYVPMSGDVGSTLLVVVTGTNVAGQASASSAATAVVAATFAPVTGLQDDFNRPNTTTGPPGPLWSPLGLTPGANLRVVSQQATGGTGTSGDYFTGHQFGPDSEAWLTVATKPTADLDFVSLLLRLRNPSLSTADGYQGFFVNRTGLDEYRIGKRVGGRLTLLAYAAGPELQPGDQLLFRAAGSRLDLIVGHAGTWSRVLSTVDTTISGAGYLGVSTKGSAVRIDDFGGGTYR